MSHATSHAFKLAGLLLFISSPAYADRIDGDWCSKDGHQLSIMGSALIAPSGSHVSGEYGRHEFAYVAPAGDKDAGTQYFLRLLDENHMLMYRLKDGEPGEPDPWRRCELKS